MIVRGDLGVWSKWPVGRSIRIWKTQPSRGDPETSGNNPNPGRGGKLHVEMWAAHPYILKLKMQLKLEENWRDCRHQNTPAAFGGNEGSDPECPPLPPINQPQKWGDSSCREGWDRVYRLCRGGGGGEQDTAPIIGLSH